MMNTSLGGNKVPSPKFTKEFVGRLVVRLRGLYRRFEILAENSFLVYIKSCAIRSVSSIIKTSDPAKSSLIIRSSPLIHGVLGGIRFSEVVFLAIKTVSINMIYVLRGTTHNQSVKRYELSPIYTTLRNVCLCVENMLSFIFNNRPSKTTHHVGVLVVDQRHLAILDWNYNHSLIVSNLGA